VAHLFGLRSCNPRHKQMFDYITYNMIMKGEVIRYILDDEMSHSNMDKIYLIYNNMFVYKTVRDMLENPHIISFLYSYDIPNSLLHLILSLVTFEGNWDDESYENDDININTIEYDANHNAIHPGRCEGHFGGITFKKASNEYFHGISPDNISRFDFLKNYYYKGAMHSSHNSIKLLSSAQSHKIKFPICSHTYFRYKKKGYITTTLDNLYVTFMRRIWNNINMLKFSRNSISINMDNENFDIKYRQWNTLHVYIKRVYMYVIQITSDKYGNLCILCNFHNYELQKIHNMFSKKYNGEGLAFCKGYAIDVEIEGGRYGYDNENRSGPYGYDTKYAGKWVLANIKIRIGNEKYFNISKIHKIVDSPEDQPLPILARTKRL